MASEREALCALEAHSEHLRALGARTMTVGKIGRESRKTYGIVALFDDVPRAVPKTLDVKVSKKVVAVPIVATSAPLHERGS